MGLRIQHNIAALNAHRQLTIADRGLSKSLEKLSSGYRINSAADDAAGLATANSMKADIASFKVASRNTSEATALLQVAAGGLSQIADMLTRVKELATQAASANAGANRTKADTEASKVIAEIDRIANSTEYADEKLINGSFGVSVLNTNSVTAAASGYSGISGMTAGYTYVFSAANAAATTLSLTAYNASGTITGEQTKYSVSAPASGSTTDMDFDALGVTLTINNAFSGVSDYAITASSAGSSTFQVGAENAANNRIAVSLGNATTSNLGVSDATIDLSTAAGAQGALTSIDAAISTLAGVQGDIGAYQNRLSFAAANLATTIENVQAAESVIRDVDMAAEMVNFTKNQILLQAGTAMLAQANMAPQQVLALFG